MAHGAYLPTYYGDGGRQAGSARVSSKLMLRRVGQGDGVGDVGAVVAVVMVGTIT